MRKPLLIALSIMLLLVSLGMNGSATASYEADCYGDAGRLILSVGVDVPLYEGGDDTCQLIVDRPRSAWISTLYRDNILIGDHYTQDRFNRIKLCTDDDTAVIEQENGEQVWYRCFAVYPDAINTGWDLITADGESLLFRSDLVIYTCNESGGTVTVVLFNQIPTPTA